MTAIVHPLDVAEAAEVLRGASAQHARLSFAGSGTKSGWAGTPDPADLTVSTSSMASMLTHHPGDLTASVQAGMRLADLQRVLAGAGQWLAIDPPTESLGATIGGLLATGEAGPRRLQYGSMRDLAIGATLVLADGSVVHTGSHVIKNVAGYDLTKLFFGSFGTLGLIGEVILRLHPLPVSSATVVAEASPKDAVRAGLALATSGVQLSAVEWSRQPGAGSGDCDETLLVRLDSRSTTTAAGLHRVQQVLAELGLAAVPLSAAEAEEQWRKHAEQTGPGAQESVVGVAILPSRLAAAIDQAIRLATTHNVHLRQSSSILLGLLNVAVTGTVPSQAAFIDELRESLLKAGASVSLRDRPAEVDAALDPMGPPPADVALMRAIQGQLDPDKRCVPGRFRGWY